MHLGAYLTELSHSSEDLLRIVSLRRKSNVKVRLKYIFFFYLGFLSRTFTIHGTAGEGGLHRHLDISRELTSAHSWKPDSNREPLVSECKSLTTKLRALKYIISPKRKSKKKLFHKSSEYIKSLRKTNWQLQRKKACKIELKYFTISFINISGCFYINYLRLPWDFRISIWLSN